MRRMYQQAAREHFQKYRQMLFLMGPRQVGKTTLCQNLKDGIRLIYLTWDNPTDRELIREGPDRVAERAELETHDVPLVIFDEIHKYGDWKNFLKGFFDSYPKESHILVTGSARLNVYKRGGDSLMGRYFYYRIHPFSVGELVDSDTLPEGLREQSVELDESQFQNLCKFGGFPDPFLNAETRFFNRWKRLRSEQLFHEDLRDLSRIQEIGQLEHLAELLRGQAGQLTSYTSLARKIRMTDNTVRSWLQTLSSFFYCFEVRPWSKNLAKALVKEPKYYLHDWSLVDDPGARAENMVACHLLKSVHFWTDHGVGDFGLYFVRDKAKREVDFVVVKDGKPWMLVEVKLGDGKKVSPSLKYFAEEMGVEMAFQVVMDFPYVDFDCRKAKRPMIIPARTFLSQLV